MRALQSLYNSQLDEREAKKSCVFRLDLNTCGVLDKVTNSDCRLFHVFAAATGKARSSIAQRLRAVLMVQPVLRTKMNTVVVDQGFDHLSNGL